ncbi:MAG: Spy/CpxP family protein refolding chaperone [Caulobacter sp.]|nr:Spy/CpxP family protein refolding chaperone [Caulobacter sp.]
MTSGFKRAALLAGVLTLAGVTAVAAQTPPPSGAGGPPRVERRVMVMGGPGGAGMGGAGMGGPGMGGMHGMHGAMDPAKHAQHMRDVLQLRPDQEGALKAFLAAMAPPAAPPAGAATPAPHAHPDAPKTTPERLAMAEKMMAEHMATFKKHNDAIRAFYGQLTPSQQKAFDALHQGMGPMHGPGMGMGRHGPGMGGPGERRVRVIRSGAPGAAGGPGGGMLIIDGDGDEEEIEIELGGPDAPDQ